jgi:DNA-binding response OmpR family regulator
MIKMLVVGDDQVVWELTEYFLQEHNYKIDKAEEPDLVVLDLTQPELVGEPVREEIKRFFQQASPVVIIATKANIVTSLDGLRLRALNYVSKPSEIVELLTRIRHKQKNIEQEVLRAGDLILNTVSVTVIRNGRNIALSPHEFRLLHYLMVNKGKVLSREMILNRVWQYSFDVDSRVVDVYIGYLRKKIDAPYKKKLIESARGFGYVIKE